MTVNINHPNDVQEIKNGFIEAMYFADVDVCFGENDALTDDSLAKLDVFLGELLPSLPTEVYEKLDASRIGNDIYYQARGHGTGFWDEDLSEATKNDLETIFDAIYVEVAGDFKGAIELYSRIKDHDTLVSMKQKYATES